MFEHFHMHWGYGNYKLGIDNHDRTATRRYIFLDLSHQIGTRSNYLNDLQEAASYFDCNQVIIFANEVSQALRDNIPHGIFPYFIKANLEPSTNQVNHQFYSLLPEEDDREEMGYVPQYGGIMSFYEFDSHAYLN